MEVILDRFGVLAGLGPVYGFGEKFNCVSH
jgi:hypothetical protein